MRSIVVFLTKLILGLGLFSFLLMVSYKWLPIYITPLMVQRTVELILGEEGRLPKSPSWLKYNDISPHMVMAVIAAEDQKFPSHSGFDWEAIETARKEIASGKRFRGGSTITNQTAKNVFLFPMRNMTRKVLEAYFSIGIEWIWGKRRIMEAYLNVIEMGNGIYGIEAAAFKYYNKPATELTRAESAMIAAILPNPRKWDPNAPTVYLRGRQAWILRNMQQLGDIEL